MASTDQWGFTRECQLRAAAKYDREHTRQICLKLNLRTDQDILKWLDRQKSMQGSIKSLIREALAKEEGVS